MRSLILTALVSAALALALPAFATDDLLAPLVGPDDPLAPLTSEPTKPKPKPGKPKPAKPAPGKPKPKPPVVEPSDEPEVDKPPVTKKVNAERITVRGVPPMALKSGQSATLTFRILDGAGKPIAAELLLLTNVGTITAAVEVNPGVFTATYAAPASGHDTSAVVHAEVKNAARPTSFDTKIMLVLTPPETQPIIATEPKHAPRPARVAFGDRLQATAGKTSTVRFQIEDEDGNPIVPADLKLRADSGRFENVREEGGSFVADYIAEDGAGEVTVMAEAGGDRLLGEGIISVESRGSKTLGFGLGAYVGVLPNFGLKAASPRFEMNLELKVLRVIRLGALVGYFPASKAGVDETVDPKQVVTVRQADFSFNVIPLLFRAAYQQPVGPIDLYGGGMIGVAFVSGKAVAVQSRTEASIEETPLNAAVFLGTGLTLGPGQVVLELRWSWLSLDYSDDVIDLSNEPGKLGGLSGALGYKLEF